MHSPCIGGRMKFVLLWLHYSDIVGKHDEMEMETMLRMLA